MILPGLVLATLVSLSSSPEGDAGPAPPSAPAAATKVVRPHGDMKVEGPLDTETVTRELLRALSTLQACTKDLPDASLPLSVEIAPDGRVVSLTAEAPNQPSAPPTYRCLVEGLSRGLRFPAVEGASSTRVSTTLQIGPIIYGSLDKSIIRGVVRDHADSIRRCYERVLTTTPGLQGKVVLKWIIHGDGKVAKANVVRSSLKNEGVERCLVERVRSWTYPKPKGGGIVVVTYPFVFKAAASEPAATP